MARTLAISVAGLRRDDPDTPWAGGTRAAVAWAASLKVRAIQLDAAAPGVRARELDRSGRRDLAALLRRSELQFTGLDLWLPGEHLKDPAHVDRAVGAIGGAIGLAAEIAPLAGPDGRLVSLALPPGVGADVVEQIGAEADRHGVRIADHAWPPAHERARPVASDSSPDAPPSRPTPAPPSIGIGLDPAAVALAGESIASAAARLADRLLSARLCDLSSAGRVLPGSADGRLDLLAYRAALSLAPAAMPVIVDVRGLHEQDAAARHMIEDWRRGEVSG